MKQQLDASIKEVVKVKTELATSKLENEQLIEFAERLRKKIDSEQKTAARKSIVPQKSGNMSNHPFAS